MRTQTAWAPCDVTLKQLRGTTVPSLLSTQGTECRWRLDKEPIMFLEVSSPPDISRDTQRHTSLLSCENGEQPWPHGLYTNRNKVAPVVDTGFQRLAPSFWEMLARLPQCSQGIQSIKGGYGEGGNIQVRWEGEKGRQLSRVCPLTDVSVSRQPWNKWESSLNRQILYSTVLR